VGDMVEDPDRYMSYRLRIRCRIISPTVLIVPLAVGLCAQEPKTSLCR